MLYTLCFLALIALILVVVLRRECHKSMCGDVIIPYPFGMSPHCFKHPSFAVNCNSSSTPPKPMLTKLNLEIIHVHLEDKESGVDYGQITVNMPWVTVCASVNTDRIVSNKSVLVAAANNEVRWTSLNLSATPFFYPPSRNAFASVGCKGSASMYNETGQEVMSCNSTCKPSPHNQSVDLAAGWCHKTIDDSTGVYEVVNFGVRVNQQCRSAFLISRTYLSLLDNNAAIATAISSDSAAPIVLDWNASTKSWGKIICSKDRYFRIKEGDKVILEE